MAEQTVFVVAGWWRYEGYAAPLAVFSTRVAAQAFAVEQKGFDDVDVREMPVYVAASGSPNLPNCTKPEQDAKEGTM